MKTAIVGGGAAGFFCAVNLKERCPEMEVTIFERSTKVLSKVEVSGGGRCNCTNSFRDVGDLSTVYPRGHRLMKRLFKVFGPHDAYEWWERHGVRLVTQDDQCVFPASQDSHTIIDCLMHECRRHGVEICTGRKIESLDELAGYDNVVITTGGGDSPLLEGHRGEPPVPSLFTFRIDDEALHDLMGTVVENAHVQLPGTKLRASGPLLITHWGMSGPAILRLSSYGARLLADNGYRMPLSVNWTGTGEADAADCLERDSCVPLVASGKPSDQKLTRNTLGALMEREGRKQLPNVRPFDLPSRLWDYLLQKGLQGRAHAPWGSLNKKELNRLVNVLTNDQYQIAGRAPFKDEFVTCGGVALSAVNPATLESRTHPGLYFAGEVLDIDGVTGGFNFQAAWTTAYVVAQAIADSPRGREDKNE